MDNDKIFNRLTGFFQQEAEKVDHLKGKLHEDAATIAKQALGRLRNGRDSMHSAEESVVRALREYRTMFYIAGASLLGLMIVAAFLFGKMSDREP